MSEYICRNKNYISSTNDIEISQETISGLIDLKLMIHKLNELDKLWRSELKYQNGQRM